ncbi:MAG TPA: VOC family protein [Pseudomonadales bacterium]|nr:VOC family protein [Pseudomonadales bacterium]
MSAPAIHHVAFACRDLEETHRFYADVLGLRLVNTEVQRRGDSCVKHVFYDTGDGSCIAFFHLRGVGEPDPLKTAISTDLGLPLWVNHLALRATAEQVEAARERLDAAGIATEMELDHGWCDSIYFTDPNGILVELCCDRPGGMPVDEVEARRLLTAGD